MILSRRSCKPLQTPAVETLVCVIAVLTPQHAACCRSMTSTRCLDVARLTSKVLHHGLA